MKQYEFKDMLLCRPDAHPQTIGEEFNRLKTKAEITQNKTLSFLNVCKEVFSHLMSPVNGKKHYGNESGTLHTSQIQKRRVRGYSPHYEGFGGNEYQQDYQGGQNWLVLR